MDGAAVENIAALSRKPFELNGFSYRPVDWIVEDLAALVKSEPTAKALQVSTLSAVRDYVTANRDALDLSKMVVHAVNPNTVHVLGPLSERSRTRETVLAANTADLTDGFLGKYMSLEDFILGLQVRFADANDRKKLLSLLSTVKHETVKTAMDDGMTQVVSARAGVALISDVAVPNPVLLTGLRAFRDIPQPSGLYVLRVQSGPHGGLPQVGLFEADGGAWKLSTLERVREWLTAALPKDVAVLA